MPRPVPVPIRRAMLRRSQHGESASQLAHSFGLPLRTVRHLLCRFREMGDGTVDPSYKSAHIQDASSQRFMRAALKMRQQHPTWGAGLIRVLLRNKSGKQSIPAERTIQRWFRRANLSPSPRGRRPSSQTNRAQRPHEVWQMDAKERVKLRSGELVSWLRLVDECSGAVLWTTVFPPRVLEPSAAFCGANATTARVLSLGNARKTAS